MLDFHMAECVRSFVHSFIQTTHYYQHFPLYTSNMTYCVEKNCTRLRSMNPIIFHTQLHAHVRAILSIGNGNGAEIQIFHIPLLYFPN